MSDNTWGFDSDDDENSSASGLRGQLEKALKELKAANARATKAEQTLAQRSVRDTLTGKGFDPELAKWIAKDDIDLGDNTAVESWLTENARLAAGFKAAGEGDEHESAPPADEAEDEAPDLSGYSRSQQVQAHGSPVSRSKLDDVLAKLPDDASPEKVRAAMQAAGL